MDNGVNMPFNTQGIDPATFGLPTFKDGWKKMIITGSSQKAINGNKGGRLILNLKCVEDSQGDGSDAGKDHLISLNMWHTDSNTADRAKSEMTSICMVVGKGQGFQNTAELYNIPFWAKAVTSTSAPTPEYPNPQPQTNWRGYRDVNGVEPGKPGVGGGANQGGGNMPNFGNNGQQPNQQQPQQQNQFQQQGNNQPQQQNNGGGNGGWGGNQPQQDQNQQQGQNNGGGWGNNGGGNNQPQQNGQNNQQQQFQQPQQQQGGNGQWSPQGGGQQPQQQQNNGGWGGGNNGNQPQQQGGGGPAPWGN